MWTSGHLMLEGREVVYTVKHYEEGSPFGIEGGRISKLWVTVDSKVILSYDRGWDLLPQGLLAKQALKALLKMYN